MAMQVDFRKDFLAYDKEYNPENKKSEILTKNGVHLSDKGNQFVAEKIMKVLLPVLKSVN